MGFLESAASGYWFPALVTVGVLIAAVRAHRARDIQRVVMAAALVEAAPFVGHWLLGGGSVFPAPGWYVLMVLAGVSIAVSIAELIAFEQSRRRDTASFGSTSHPTQAKRREADDDPGQRDGSGSHSPQRDPSPPR
jgi:cyanate permease